MPRRVSFPVDLEDGAREGRKRANAALKRRMGPKSHLSQFGSPIDSLEERRRASSPALCSELRSRSSYALVSATIFSRRLRAKKDFSVHHTLNLELISPPHRERPSFGPKKGIWERLAAESDVSKQFSQVGCSAACRAEFFSSDADGVSRGVVEESLRRYQTVKSRWRPGRTATRGGTEPPPH